MLLGASTAIRMFARKQSAPQEGSGKCCPPIEITNRLCRLLGAMVTHVWDNAKIRGNAKRETRTVLAEIYTRPNFPPANVIHSSLSRNNDRESFPVLSWQCGNFRIFRKKSKKKKENISTSEELGGAYVLLKSFI